MSATADHSTNAFAGAIEDFPIADVLHLLHLARKSGQLTVTGPNGARAAVMMKDGAIVGARHPAAGVNVGQILVERGELTTADLDAALATQAQAPRPLVTLLVDSGKLTQERGYAALVALVEKTIAAFLEWKIGTFSFDVAVVAPDDDFQHFPSAGLGLNTEQVLLDAMRILDEAARCSPPAPPAPAAEPSAATTTPVRPLPLPLGDPDTQAAVESALTPSPTDAPYKLGRVAMLTTDGFTEYSLRRLCRDRGIDLAVYPAACELVDALRAGAEDHPTPVIVLDAVRAGSDGRRLEPIIRQLAELGDAVTVIALAPATPRALAATYAQGADVVLPRPLENGDRERYVAEMKAFFEAFLACVESVLARRRGLTQTLDASRRQISQLKARSHELRSRVTSPDVSLALLRYVAETMERCILFLVRGDNLLGLGGCGLDVGHPKASLAALRLKIPVRPGSLLSDVIDKGVVFHGPTSDASLAEHLFAQIGAPATAQILLTPLRADQRTIALIYGDFGNHPALPVFADALEILAVQASMALDLALMRMRASGAPAARETL